jgi:murein DD-endopeptidase MepM/ murein hydrolase activator NlpD
LFFIITLCLLFFQPASAQQKGDLIDLLIECYQFLYAPQTIETPVVEAIKPFTYTCVERPRNFYDDFSDTRIGFDLLTQIRNVNIFQFRDTEVAPPLKIPLRITSKYAEIRPGSIHQGIDFGLSIGDTIYSSFCGEVRIVAYQPSGYGNVVVVRNYNMSETLYGHLDKSLVHNGQKVVAGEPIAIGGNTGTSTGPHLHFEIRVSGYSFNPMLEEKFFKKYVVTY